MNKKNITLIMAGILIQVLEFTITINHVKIDIFSDIIGYILILIGITPLIIRNNLFKKCKSTAVKALVSSILIQLLYVFDSEDPVIMAGSAIATIFSIYFTYYFTESIMLESKMQDKAALTRNFRYTWFVLGIFIFANYTAFISNISFLSIIIKAVTIICTIYYASTVLNTCERLYMDELPNHSKYYSK